MDNRLVLSIFPGIDLLGRAFEEEGFCVARGPDVLWGGDIRRFHPPAGVFGGVIGGPPCAVFSSLVHIIRAGGREPRFGNLIPEFGRCVAEAAPQWFLMENAPRSPAPRVSGYGVHSFIFNNRQLGESQNRKRRISFGWRDVRRVLLIDTVALENPRFDYCASGGGRAVPIKIGGSGKVKITFTSPAACHGGEARRLRRASSLVGQNIKSQDAFRTLCRLQGLPDDFDLPGLKVEAKCQAVGNSVPMAMGRALAKAVAELLEPRDRKAAEAVGGKRD